MDENYIVFIEYSCNVTLIMDFENVQCDYLHHAHLVNAARPYFASETRNVSAPIKNRS